MFSYAFPPGTVGTRGNGQVSFRRLKPTLRFRFESDCFDGTEVAGSEIVSPFWGCDFSRGDNFGRGKRYIEFSEISIDYAKSNG